MYAHLYRYNTNKRSREKEIIDVEVMNSQRCRDNLTFFTGMHTSRPARDRKLSRNKRGNKRRNAFFRS